MIGNVGVRARCHCACNVLARLVRFASRGTSFFTFLLIFLGWLLCSNTADAQQPEGLSRALQKHCLVRTCWWQAIPHVQQRQILP